MQKDPYVRQSLMSSIAFLLFVSVGKGRAPARGRDPIAQVSNAYCGTTIEPYATDTGVLPGKRTNSVWPSM